jgi:hypothetical protein
MSGMTGLRASAGKSRMLGERISGLRGEGDVAGNGERETGEREMMREISREINFLV